MSRTSATDSKSLQLCAQARRALEFALETECRDAALADLVVVDVVPAPSAKRLRVWLRGPTEMNEEDRGRRLRRLLAARGFLRARVADAVHRRHAPELVFELLPGALAAEERTR
jgi:ribosome-binding factor A